MHTSTRKNAWDRDDTYSGLYVDDYDHLLFGAAKTEVHVSTLHPEQVHIFRLWQIYIENIDPLLKVTHTPTLQARIINAVSNLEAISPSLEALMFSIYCVSVLSLTNQECRAFFGSPRSDLQSRFHFACQQSLLNCKALRSGTVESLTALYLYLVSLITLIHLSFKLRSHQSILRSRLDHRQTLDLWHLRLPSPSAWHNDSACMMTPHIVAAMLSSLRCVDGFGGLWSLLTIAFAKCPIIRPQI